MGIDKNFSKKCSHTTGYFLFDIGKEGLMVYDTAWFDTVRYGASRVGPVPGGNF